MDRRRPPVNGMPHRYSAKRMAKPVNFFCFAPGAQAVSIAGDFNDWHPESDPMQRQPDGSWVAQLPLNHGHHRYWFMVDGEPMLDPNAQGITRNDRNDRVSLIAVS